jgi:Flp pilus assembly protein TadG
MMLRRLRDDERGEATEAVLVTPVLLFLVMLVFQFGLWYHAEHVAQAAAQEGVRTARLEGGSADDGQRRAADFLARAGAKIVGDPVVSVTRNDETAVVEIRGQSVAVVPGLRMPIRARSESPVERFRP